MHEEERVEEEPVFQYEDFKSAAESYREELAYKRYAGSRVGMAASIPLKEKTEDGKLIWNFHEGQMKIMNSKKRYIIALGGRQSGKSESGPPWLYEEMKARGPGWYMVVAPTYPVLEDSALPKLVDYFQRDLNLGFLRKNPLKFVISEEGERRLWGHSGLLGVGKESVIRFGHGTNASSLEAKTSLGCWIDEGGQPEFRPESYEAIEGRHTTTEGRILVSTTPYDLGYLKKRFFDPWLAAGRNHPTIDIIQWKSIANPAFPREEYDRLKAIMPAWRHAMFYDGEFSVPAGLIYDIVRERESEIAVSPFMIPHNWPRYAGLDFGGINTAAIFAAMNPYERVLYLYTKFHPGTAGRVKDHADEIRKIAGGHLERVIGGAKSEDNWRDQYYEAGMMVEKPSIPEVHAGIARVYSLFAAGRLKVFNTSCDEMNEWWNEVYTYRYETDATTGETLPDMKIIDQNKFHLMDAMRYLGTGFADMVHPSSLARAGGERSQVDDYAAMNEALFKAKNPDSGNPYSVGRAGGAGTVRRTKLWSPMARDAAFLRARRMR